MDLIIMFIWIFVLFGWLLYRSMSENISHFKDRGIKYVTPVPVIGNLLNVFLKKDAYFDLLQKFYNKFYHEKVFGFYNIAAPNLIIKDPNLIKQITIKDFDNFPNHETAISGLDKLFSKSLFALNDETWREMRSTLSPLFTSSKMKMMFDLQSEMTLDFIKYFEEKSNEKIIIDARDIFARFTVDGIATSALGFKGDCLRDNNSYVYKIAESTADLDFLSFSKITLGRISLPIYNFFNLELTSKETFNFFYDAIVKVMKEREEKGIFRADIIQLLLQTKKGQLKDKSMDVDDKDLTNFSANIEYDVGGKTKKVTQWTDLDFMAQGWLFFAAGFDTTANLLQMTSYELAMNPEVQQELIEEIDEVISNLNEKPVTYEALHKMKYLDMVVSESLRMWPPAMINDRQCNKDYNLDLGNGKSLKIYYEETIIIPVAAIQRDPKYFENPDKFDPQRFNDTRKNSIVPGTYIPFGIGPRVCIGSRFALMEAKLLLFNVLSKFTIEKCDKTPKKLEFYPDLGSFKLKEKIFVEFKPRT